MHLSFCPRSFKIVPFYRSPCLLCRHYLTEFVALLCLVKMLPNIWDIFSSELGQRTIEELGKENVSLEKIRTTFSIISQDIWNGWMQEFFIIIALTSVAIFLNLYYK